MGAATVILNGGLALQRPDLLPPTQPTKRSNDERLVEMEGVVRRAEVGEEFGRVPLKRASAGTSTAQLAECAGRNRRHAPLPYEDTRLRLTPSKANPHGYVNASNVQVPLGPRLLRYIATQGPLPHTVADFWQMVWEAGAQVLVMLTRTEEKGQERCAQYWPSKAQGKAKLKFGDFSVTLASSTATKTQVASTLTLKHCPSGQRRTVYHLQFLPWPVGGVPSNVDTFLHFLDEVSSVRRHAENEGRAGSGSEGRSRASSKAASRLRSPSTGGGSLNSSGHSSSSGSWSRRILGARNGAGASPALSVPSSEGERGGQARPAGEADETPPLVVHCSSGAGRTGTFLLAHLAMAALDHNQDLGPARALALLRQQRPRLVATPAQFHFVYDALIAYLANSRLI